MVQFSGGTSYEPVNSIPEVKIWNEKIVNIDDKGMFTRILLIELDRFSKEIYGKEPRPYMLGEIEELTNFLYEIATKKQGQDVPLQFIRAHMKVGIVLVAKRDKIADGIKPYIDAIKVNLSRGMSSVYLIIFSAEMRKEQINDLENQLKTASIRKDLDVSYDIVDYFGRKCVMRCIRYHPN